MMQLSAWLEEARTKLKAAGIESWHKDAGSIAEHLLKLSDSDLILGELDLEPSQLTKLNLILKQRLSGTPLAYIFKTANFYGRDFYVDNRVLIPRPETESLIEFILSLNLKRPSILDVGTGSGIIGLSLSLEIPESQITMLDVSRAALEVAKLNHKKRLKEIEAADSGVKFSQSDLLKDYDGPKVDLIVANLPYVDRTWDWLDLSSLSFEPALALWAEDSGLSLIKELISQAGGHLKKNGYLILEMDPSQKEAAADFALSLNQNTEWKLVDSNGFSDFVLALKKI